MLPQDFNGGDSMTKIRYALMISCLILIIPLYTYDNVDSSNDWVLLDTNIKTALHSIFFLNEHQGWGVSFGNIYYTDDGGKNWKERFKVEKSKAYFPELRSICFANKENGWVVGDDHIILHTNNGGKSWDYQESGLEPINILGVKKTLDLFSVHFADDNHGWAVGFLGTIISTNDGGRHWKRQRSKTNGVLWKVFLVDEDTGWAVGSDGTILHTEDGGAGLLGGIIGGWKKQESNSYVHLFDVYFIDQNNGWAVGANEILCTNNGGISWTRKQIEGAKHLDGVRFINKEIGWVIGTNKIYGTKDAGKTWQVIESGTSQWLHRIFFLDKNHGWIAGGNGVILRYRQ